MLLLPRPCDVKSVKTTLQGTQPQRDLLNLYNILKALFVSFVLQMENIGWFSNFVMAFGVQQEYGFVTVDLFEKQNVTQVSKRVLFLA